MVKLLLLLSSLLFASTLYADELSLLERVETQKLYDSPGWRALIHTPLGRKSSFSRDRGFFISGVRDDPHTELLSSLKSLLIDKDRSLQCRFPARTKWLAQAVGVELGELKCPELKEWISDIAPTGATLVFADAFINNPASMFGHTFLRIDTQFSTTPLLSYGSHYAAHTGDDVGPLYAMKGIFGGYDGFFSLSPYYQSVSAYNDIEQRDLWEYKLNLSPPEVEFLLLHLWELRNVPFAYYYFDENCSYHLLALLDVVRPELGLQERALPWVIPVDSLKVITASGLVVGEPKFRAARTSRLVATLKALTKEERAISQRLGTGKGEVEKELEGRPGARKALILDAAYEILEQGGKGGDTKRSILSARSKVEGGSINVETPSTPPDEGHPSRRVTGGVTARGRSPGLSFEIRPSYHSIEDPQGGYADGLSIELLTPQFHVSDEGVSLEKFTVVNLLSLYPWDDVFQKISWGATAGYGDLLFSNKKGGALSIGLGGTMKAGTIVGYALLGPRVEGNFDAGLSLRLGAYADLSPTLRILASGEGDVRQGSMSLTGRFTLDRNYALLLQGEANTFGRQSASLSILYYW